MPTVRTLFAPLLAVALPIAASAQTAEQVRTRHPVSIDSGVVANTNPSPAARGIPAVVWSTVVSVPGVAWVRLRYSGIALAGHRDRGVDGSFLRITSLLDNQFQTQHLVHVDQWRDTSAYFNGDSVLVELLAHPDTGPNRLMIDEVTAGPSLPPGRDTICGPTDDRVLSTDPRCARVDPVGCSAWILDDCNHCFLTAGHCSGTAMQIVEFNVPLSTSSGALVHPGPQHQYAIDLNSVQSNGGGAPGNDWAYFGVYANSTTGLTPFQANNGQAFTLLAATPTATNQSVRVTGYGTVAAPVSPTWEQVQKTHAGPYVQLVGSRIDYRTDTTGGNSGSPAFLDGTNVAIGIHTHGGCTGSSGENSGTAGNHAALQAALAGPTGICYCAPITFRYPNGQPTLVSPGGVTTIRMQIGGIGQLQPGSLQFHWSYAANGPFQTIAPTSLGNNLFEVVVPAANCEATLQYYWVAQDSNNLTFHDPSNAPTSRHTAIAATNLATIRSHDFNTAPPGWTVSDTNVTAGSWTRATPADPFGPPTDYDGSGQCWVTGNAQFEDLDGGPTRLRTETIDVSAATNPVVRYALWFTCNSGNDRLIVEATQDNGTNWVVVQNLGAFAGWEVHGFRVLDHFAAPGQLSVRFSVSDNPNNSQTEAGLDAFLVADATCPPPSWTPFGTGCAPSGPAPALALVSPPAIGGVFVLTTSNLGSGAPIMIAGFTPTAPPVSLTPYGWGATCRLYVTPDAAFFVPGGILGFAIPNDPGLSGIRLHYQLVEVGPVLAASDAGIAEIR